MMEFLPPTGRKLMFGFLLLVSGLFSSVVNAQCTATGDQTTYGQNQWIGYVYSNGTAYTTTPPASASAFTYRGYYTQSESFDYNPGTGAISGANICGSYADYFTVKYKMNKTYTAGYYNITVGADDGYRLSLDGGATWYATLSDWALHSYTTKTATVYLSGSTNLVLEYFENGGSSRVSFSITSASCDSTAPTAITGTTALDCTTTSTTLTATGGTLGAGAVYQWGTGTVGQNIISGQTGSTLTVSPNATTTYWVRRVNASPCSGFTAEASATVSVSGRGTDPSVFGANTWNVYTYNGGNIDVSTLPYFGSYTQSGVSFNTLNSWASSASPSSATGYQGCTVPVDYFTFVAKRKGFPCGNYVLTMAQWDDEAIVYINGVQAWYSATWGAAGSNAAVGSFSLDENSTVEIRVREINGGANAVLNFLTSVAPTSITGVTAIGCGVNSTTLTAAGGSISGSAVYQWGTGSVAGQNIISGATTASITVSPTATTTYWVRLINYNNCTPNSDAVFTTVTYTPVPGDPTVFGDNTWNVYGYNGSSLALSGVTYLGYYTQSTLGIATTSAWTNTLSPSSATNWQGCTVANDNFTYVYKRKGFPCGRYTLKFPSWDDEVAIYINGSLVWTGYYGNSNYTVGVYDLDANSTIEIRSREATGPAYFNFTITQSSVAPTAITGVTALTCGVTTTTLTATGGSLSGNSAYQWGTGSVAGQNIISGATTASITVSPTATTTYWVRIINFSSCQAESAAVSTTVTVTPVPGDPTVFGSGIWNVYGYSGSNVSLTGVTYLGYYTQSTLGFDNTAAWGASLSPSSATNWQGCTVPVDAFTYVYKRQNFPCGRYTLTMTRWDDEAVVYINGTQVWNRTASGTNVVIGTYDLDATSTIEVRVRDINSTSYGILAIAPASVPPTGITGITTIGCPGGSTTLTAIGGSISGSTVYQWGTGSVAGQNIISGATTATITVTPGVTTTYWVRLSGYNACATYSSAVSTTVTVTGIPGNPSNFGTNIWNAYGYSGTSLTLSGATYLGYYTQNSVSFDTATGTNSWAATLSPSASAGWQGCTVPNDNFVVVYKRQGFDCGSYRISLTRWDDDAELYIDGVRVWNKTAYSGATAVNEIVGTYTLNENTAIEFRVHEITGNAGANVVFTPLSTLSVAPTSITGPVSALCGSSVTLTALGGVLGTNAVYEWGSGTVGSNIITGATTASVTVTPSVNTTYWVRIKNVTCSTYTAAVTYAVQAASTVAGILSAPAATVCKNAVPTLSITLAGYVGSIVKWQYADDAAFTTGVTDVANTTAVLTGAQIGALSATRYYRAVVQNGACVAMYTPVFQLTVPAPLQWTGTWNGTPTIDTAIEILSDLPLSSDLTVCSCEVKNSAAFNVASGVNLTVKGKVTVAQTATMTLANNASLVQIDDVANSGNIVQHRNSSLIKRLDYTLWSSPVDSQQLLAFSPQTVTTRFYEYNPASDQYATVSPQNNFETAKAYLIRTPNNHPTTPTAFEGVFTGTPHNGAISKQLSYTAGTNSFNAVGNPYPSPISLNDFINANINNIEGTLWFWRKSNDYTQSSYTVLTKLAYVANSAPGGENGYATDPHGVINTGQGFIVKARTNTLVFTNSMRRTNSSNQFFRTASTDLSRYWISVTDASGSFTQAAVGYTAEATLGYDNGLDGRAFVDNNINLYSLQDDNKLAIQGRPTFDVSDVVPFGFKATNAGSYTFNIVNTDGLFAADQAIYIMDMQEGLAVNLKAHSYTFTTEAGTFNNRFKVIYRQGTLGTDTPVANDTKIVVYGSKGVLSVVAEEEIASVAVYDLLGRELLNKNHVNALTFSGDTGSSEQVLIVKVKTVSGKVSDHKIILN